MSVVDKQLSWEEELDLLTRFNSLNSSFSSHQRGNEEGEITGEKVVHLEEYSSPSEMAKRDAAAAAGEITGKKVVHLEEYISPAEMAKRDAAAGSVNSCGMKMISAGRGIRMRNETDDSFIGKQIEETLGTGHRNSGSISPGSSSSAHHKMIEEGNGRRIVVMRPKLANVKGRGRKSMH